MAASKTVDAFGADWMRGELPFARNKKELRNFEAFDEALRAAQTSDKGELSKNVNAAAKVALNLTSSSGIKHVVARLCLVSKDPMMRKETAVYTIDSIMRHAAKDNNEELRGRFQKYLQRHLRNIFKRAIKNDATRQHLAETFFNKILAKWKDKGWFDDEIDAIVSVVSGAVPDLEKPDQLLPDYAGVKEDSESEAEAVEMPPPPRPGPGGLGSSWMLGRAGATFKAGAPPTPAQPGYLRAPGTPRGPDGFPLSSPQVLSSVPSTPKFETKTVLMSVPSTPNPHHVLMSVPATPRYGMSMPMTPGFNRLPQTPTVGNFPARIPATPHMGLGGHAMPMTPAGGGALLRIPQTPFMAMPSTPAGGGVLLRIPQTPFTNSIPSTPRVPSGNIPGTPGVGMPSTPAVRYGNIPSTPRAGMPSTPRVGGHAIPNTPRAIPMTPGAAASRAIPSTPRAIPATPGAKEEAPGTPGAGSMTPASFQPFTLASVQQVAVASVQPFTQAGLGISGGFQPFAQGAQPFTPAQPSFGSGPFTLPPKVEAYDELQQPQPEASEPPTSEPPTVPTYSMEPSVEQPVASVEQPVPSAGGDGMQPGMLAEEVPTMTVPQPSEELSAEVPTASSMGSEAKRRRLTVRHGDQSGREA